ncbi:PTS sugar transporter subunit IIB, partial [Lactobacillus equicursoris]|nr:PTS sugar transporter subunit IIB [Lactobacillus equicursoris]
SEADNKLANQEINCVLLGPQVGYMKADFEKKLEGTGIPMGVIPMQDYGMMNGKKVLEFADSLMA